MLPSIWGSSEWPHSERPPAARCGRSSARSHSLGGASLNSPAIAWICWSRGSSVAHAPITVLQAMPKPCGSSSRSWCNGRQRCGPIRTFSPMPVPRVSTTCRGPCGDMCRMAKPAQACASRAILATCTRGGRKHNEGSQRQACRSPRRSVPGSCIAQEYRR